MITQSTEIKRLVLVRINPGEDILISMRKAVDENDIKTALIIGGLGSLQSFHYHVVTSCDLPPEEGYPKEEGPYDICTMTGLVIDGRVHAHITFSDIEKVQGGHLEEGCRALTFSVVVLAETPDAKLTGWDKIGGI
jgi:predicted DNA-binding protein with PD1-like motif